jgi:hypothetical protein
MRDIYRLELEQRKSNKTFWNRLFSEPKYDIHMFKNGTKVGTLAFSRTREESLDIQEIFGNTILYSSEGVIKDPTVKDEKTKNQWLFVFYVPRSIGGAAPHLEAIFEPGKLEEAKQYICDSGLSLSLEIHTCIWDGKGRLPLFGNTTLIDSAEEIKDRIEFQRLKKKFYG